MSDKPEEPVISKAQSFLQNLGGRVRAIRNEHSLSRRELSQRSGVSPRFIAQLESGDGNISICRLKCIVDAMGTTLDEVIPATGGDDEIRFTRLFCAASPEIKQRVAGILGQSENRDKRAQRIALTGLRGAGKSTIGLAAAERLNIPFVELTALMEQVNGLEISEIFALYGPQGFRRLENQCLGLVAQRYQKVILAVAGGIVEEKQTFGTLLEHFTTIWLSASPDEHMSRVIAQGDQRPMADNPSAMDELMRILEEREALYAQAPFHIDTSGRSIDETREELVMLLRDGIFEI